MILKLILIVLTTFTSTLIFANDCSYSVIGHQDSNVFEISLTTEDKARIHKILSKKGYHLVDNGAKYLFEIDKVKVHFPDGEKPAIGINIYFHESNDITGINISGKSSIGLFRKEAKASKISIKNAFRFIPKCF